MMHFKTESKKSMYTMQQCTFYGLILLLLYQKLKRNKVRSSHAELTKHIQSTRVVICFTES